MRAWIAFCGLVFAILGATTTIAGDRYQFVGKSNDPLVYLNIDNLVTVGHLVDAWSVMVFSDGAFGMFRSSFDCVGDTSTMLYVQLYHSDGGSGQMDNVPGPTDPIIPGSFGDTAFLILCKHQPTDKKLTFDSLESARQAANTVFHTNP